MTTKLLSAKYFPVFFTKIVSCHLYRDSVSRYPDQLTAHRQTYCVCVRIIILLISFYHFWKLEMKGVYRGGIDSEFLERKKLAAFLV